MLPFARPWILVFLVVPAWLFIRAWRRSDGKVVLPFDHSRARSSRVLAVLVDFAESLPTLILAVVVLILAGPQQLGEPQSGRQLTNIEFCVDISGSMTAPFGEGTRYDAAMTAINRFVDFRKGDAFGLTFFGNSVLHWTPLTSDVSAIKCATPFMRPERNIPGFGGTEIARALIACKKVLAEREEGDRMIILVSDGLSADLFGNRSSEVAAELKQNRVIVYAIHISETTVPPDIVNVSRLTGGDVFGVDDPGALEAVFERIDQMQQTKMVQLAPDTLDDFRPYSLVGMALVGLASLCLFGVRYTPW